METPVTQLDLEIRYHIYRFFAEHDQAPTGQDIVDLLNLAADEVRESFHKLHERPMIFLEPDSGAIRMTNPFSAILTRFKVTSGSNQWWANYAWDSLGIAAERLVIEGRYRLRTAGAGGRG